MSSGIVSWCWARRATIRMCSIWFWRKNKQNREVTMQVAGKVVVVTGGANGIGSAPCQGFHLAGAAKVIVVDGDGPAARAVAHDAGGDAFKCDVAKEKDIQHVIDETE